MVFELPPNSILGFPTHHLLKTKLLSAKRPLASFKIKNKTVEARIRLEGDECVSVYHPYSGTLKHFSVDSSAPPLFHVTGPSEI